MFLFIIYVYNADIADRFPEGIPRPHISNNQLLINII